MSNEFFDEIRRRVDDLTQQIEATPDKSKKRSLQNHRGRLRKVLNGSLTPNDLHANHRYTGKSKMTSWGSPNERVIISLSGRGLEDTVRYKSSTLPIGSRYPSTTVLLFLSWASRDVTPSK